MAASVGSGFVFTKEKLVFLVSFLVSVSSFMGIHKPVTEDVPRIPAEEQAHEPRVTVPVPSLHPDKPLDGSARDPFVPSSAWIAATPARLGALPEPPSPRLLPSGVRRAYVTLDADPKPVEEPDAPSPPKEGGDK